VPGTRGKGAAFESKRPVAQPGTFAPEMI